MIQFKPFFREIDEKKGLSSEMLFRESIEILEGQRARSSRSEFSRQSRVIMAVIIVTLHFSSRRGIVSFWETRNFIGIVVWRLHVEANRRCILGPTPQQPRHFCSFFSVQLSFYKYNLLPIKKPQTLPKFVPTLRLDLVGLGLS